MNCDTRERMVAHLAEIFHETPVSRGVSQFGQLVEVLASRNGETFTIMLTTPDRISCLLVGGTDWHKPAPALLEEDDGA